VAAVIIGDGSAGQRKAQKQCDQVVPAYSVLGGLSYAANMSEREASHAMPDPASTAPLPENAVKPGPWLDYCP